MSAKVNTHEKTLKLVQLAFLAALIIVLQLLSYMIKIGSFPLSLVLIPLALGGMMMGPGAGAFLGGVFGLVVFCACAGGMDAGGFILFGINPFLTFLVCMVKGIAAGLLSALLYRVIKKATKGSVYPSALIASIITPVVNTGLFCIGMLLFFHSTLVEWAGGSAVVSYVFLGLIGVNFVIEFLINLIISPILAATLSKTKALRNQF